MYVYVYTSCFLCFPVRLFSAMMTWLRHHRHNLPDQKLWHPWPRFNWLLQNGQRLIRRTKQANLYSQCLLNSFLMIWVGTMWNGFMLSSHDHPIYHDLPTVRWIWLATKFQNVSTWFTAKESDAATKKIPSRASAKAEKAKKAAPKAHPKATPKVKAKAAAKSKSQKQDSSRPKGETEYGAAKKEFVAKTLSSMDMGHTHTYIYIPM